ncbi:MAG: hypothetical protein E7H45_09730 [Lacticaseibacillus rhamnosus]|nr:hypothetical protein [Lacticaseibacillus rhamnosus]
MYDRIRKIDNSLVDFDLTLNPEDKTSIWEGAFRPILVSSYGLVTFGTVVVIAFALGGFYGK